MPTDQMIVEAELKAPVGTFQVLQYEWTQPNNNVLEAPGDHVLDLCLTPRPQFARGRYRECWASQRFERIGDIFFVPAGYSMHGRSESGRQASVMCHLHAEPLKEWFDDALDWTERRLEASLNIASPTIRGLLLRLANEARAPGFASLILTEMITAQLAIELTRYFHQVSETPQTGGLAPWQLRLIDERLTESLEAPTLRELATLCRISTRHLTRAFRTSRGVSVGDHVANTRLDNAKRLLAERDSIKEVAFILGFASPSAFSFAFHKATGQAPSQFRRRSQLQPEPCPDGDRTALDREPSPL
jgi:AraC family transcriptional regulator